MTEKGDFSKALIMWYLIHKRDLPWRRSKDPYRIWLSEIILQQTRVAQGTSYYMRFVDEFKDVTALAGADENRVLKLWQGLGYYSRARNLHSTAQFIAKNLEGRFPDSYDDLKKLKGIGDYTASAIASIAFDLPHATVDGNVFRVLSRHFGIDAPIDSSHGIKEFKVLASELLDHDDPGKHNQALMELGALVCTPKNPKCADCPVQNSCFAHQSRSTAKFPVKKTKIKVRKRYLSYLVLDTDDRRTHLVQRTEKDIWRHLYQFPVLETEGGFADEAALLEEARAAYGFGGDLELIKFNPSPWKHKLSHQELHADFWIVRPGATSPEHPTGTVGWDQLENYGIPVLLQNFVDAYRSSGSKNDPDL